MTKTKMIAAACTALALSFGTAALAPANAKSMPKHMMHKKGMSKSKMMMMKKGGMQGGAMQGGQSNGM